MEGENNLLLSPNKNNMLVGAYSHFFSAPDSDLIQEKIKFIIPPGLAYSDRFIEENKGIAIKKHFKHLKPQSKLSYIYHPHDRICYGEKHRAHLKIYILVIRVLISKKQFPYNL